MSKPSQPDLLEVEDEDSRQQRIERLLSSQSSTSKPIPKPLISPIGERKTYAVPPPTDLLARLEAFLPAMKQANEELEKKIAKEGQESVNVEHSGPEAVESDGSEDAEGEDEEEEEEDDSEAPHKPYIEMNLGLGVFEQRSKDSSQPGGPNPLEVLQSDGASDSDDSNKMEVEADKTKP